MLLNPHSILFVLQCLDDKDAIVNFIAGSRDMHMQVIDAREDRLVTRARQWATDLVNNLQACVEFKYIF